MRDRAGRSVTTRSRRSPGETYWLECDEKRTFARRPIERCPAQIGAEERREIGRIHAAMDHYQLDGRVRWLGVHLPRSLAGELYRVIADHRGALVQPARFDAFRLTLIEAMATGLPTFATCFGGPFEIIEDGTSGFHIDPNHSEAAAVCMAEFFADCRGDPGRWEVVSRGALARVEERYTWRFYANRLMTLACV